MSEKLKYTTHFASFLGAGGIKPVAHLLHEFLLEVRYRWESGVLIPGLPPGTPDHAYGLFHQKLQMINCCIERKQARQDKEKEAAGGKSNRLEQKCKSSKLPPNWRVVG